MYSARYGNVYTVRQLRQLLREALADRTLRDTVWERDGRYFDALRPGVEPDGLSTEREVRLHRRDHLLRVGAAVDEADLLIFTLGLTEAWTNIEHGTVYPTAPGTVAGRFDPARYAFVNFDFAAVLNDFLGVRKLLRRVRPQIRFLLTVSPVPLVATASSQHVLAATTYSKSLLRAVAGQLAGTYPDVDYFPSYELVATPFLGRSFYEDDQRTVTSDGVAAVMEIFFGAHGAVKPVAAAGDVAKRIDERTGMPVKKRPDGIWSEPGGAQEEAVCEEMLLEAFAPQ
jgi:hypothetical protein